jgi:hypothetical protein
MRRAALAQGILVSLGVIVPVLAFLVVRLADFPGPCGIVGVTMNFSLYFMMLLLGVTS